MYVSPFFKKKDCYFNFCKKSNLRWRIVVNLAPCFCAGAVEYSRTLLHHARRKTRPCLTLHPPIGTNPCLSIGTITTNVIVFLNTWGIYKKSGLQNKMQAACGNNSYFNARIISAIFILALS